MDIDALKDHIDDKFDHQTELDRLAEKRLDEILATYKADIKDNKEAVKRVHTRVDGIATQIKIVKGVGTVISGALGTAAAYIGLKGGG